MIRNFEMKIHDIFKFYGTCFHILKINTLDYELSLFFLFIFNKRAMMVLITKIVKVLMRYDYFFKRDFEKICISNERNPIK